MRVGRHKRGPFDGRLRACIGASGSLACRTTRWRGATGRKQGLTRRRRRLVRSARGVDGGLGGAGSSRTEGPDGHAVQLHAVPVGSKRRAIRSSWAPRALGLEAGTSLDGLLKTWVVAETSGTRRRIPTLSLIHISEPTRPY